MVLGSSSLEDLRCLPSKDAGNLVRAIAYRRIVKLIPVSEIKTLLVATPTVLKGILKRETPARSGAGPGFMSVACFPLITQKTRGLQALLATRCDLIASMPG